MTYLYNRRRKPTKDYMLGTYPFLHDINRRVVGHPINYYLDGTHYGGFFLFDWFKKIFTPKNLRAVGNVALNVGKKIAPSIESATLKELEKSKTGKKFANIYNTGKQLGKDIYTSGKKIHGEIKGSGAQELINAIQQIESSEMQQKGMGIGDIRKIVTDEYMPQLIKKLKGSGIPTMIVSKRMTGSGKTAIKRQAYTPNRRKLLGANIERILDDYDGHEGGAIGAILASTLPALIPVGMEIAKQIVPMIEQIFLPKGSGFDDSEKMENGFTASENMKSAITQELLDMIAEKQSGGSIGSFFKSIGSKVLPFLKKILPGVANVAKAIFPVAENVIGSELEKSKTGRNIIGAYQGAKDVYKSGRDIYNTGRNVYKSFRN